MTAKDWVTILEVICIALLTVHVLCLWRSVKKLEKPTEANEDDSQ